MRDQTNAPSRRGMLIGVAGITAAAALPAIAGGTRVNGKMSVKNIVLVHGAFAGGSNWSKVIPLLTAKGYAVTAVQNPLSSLYDDVVATRRVIDMQDGPVILAGHSWGGAVISEAGNHPRVAGLVYVAAAAPDSGSNFDEWWKNQLPVGGLAGVQPFGEGGIALSENLATAQADLCYSNQRPLAARCYTDRISRAAWRTKPADYIVAENDLTIPPAVQKIAAKRMNGNTTFLQNCHVPMLTQPSKVAEVIADRAKSIKTA